MIRLLSDNDVQGHVSRLLGHGQLPPWAEIWHDLGCVICTFDDFQLAADATDAVVWQVCQDHEVLLITGNRNADGPQSLEMTIRQRNTAECLPVLTLADPDRILSDRSYLEAIVERLFEILIDIDALRGSGRLYLP